MKKYSYVQAANLIHMNYKQLYDWRDEGVLDKVLTPPITKLSEEEVDYLRGQMTPPKGGLRMQDLKRYFTLSDQTLKIILPKYNIYPLKKHYSHAISVKYDYYDGHDLTRIQNAIIDLS